MLSEKTNRTLKSLLKKDYTVEFWSENNFCFMLSFYHLNSVYNGLVYIHKKDGRIRVDFQYHQKNKTVEKQLKLLSNYLLEFYNNNNLDQFKLLLGLNIIEADKIYHEKYSFFRGA